MIDITVETTKEVDVTAEQQEEIEVNCNEYTGGGVSEHQELTGREKPDQHPIDAITNLATTLSDIQESVEESEIEPISNTRINELLTW